MRAGPQTLPYPASGCQGTQHREIVPEFSAPWILEFIKGSQIPPPEEIGILSVLSPEQNTDVAPRRWIFCGLVLGKTIGL
jgi:hypothetical protein